MGINTTKVKESFEGDGVQTSFPFSGISYLPYTSSQVFAIFVDEVLVSTGVYIAEGEAVEGVITGGTVVFIDPPDLESVIDLVRVTPLSQPTVFTSVYSKDSARNTADRLLMQIQEVNDKAEDLETEFENLDRSPARAMIPDWDTATKYIVDQVVFYDNKPKRLFRCLVDHESTVFVTDFLDNYWEEILLAGSGSSSGGAGAVPVGGEEGSVLAKVSGDDGDTEWKQYAYTGFSARFNADFNSTNLDDTLQKILNITYTAPQVSLSASGNSLREKGTPVTATTLSANVTKRSDDIAKIEFFLGATSLDVQEPPSNTGSGTTTYAWTGNFSDNTTFKVEVTDNGDSGGPTTVSSTTTFSFVYPYYTGTGAPSLSAAAVAGLTKRVVNSNPNFNVDFTTTSGQVYYFAYPASYGALSSILDENGFETIGDWTLRTENITGLDSNPVSYRIYEFNNPVAAGSTNYTFRR